MDDEELHHRVSELADRFTATIHHHIYQPCADMDEVQAAFHKFERDISHIIERHSVQTLSRNKLPAGGRPMKKVKLKELAEQMDFMLDKWRYFFDKSSCEIISIDEQYLGYAEELEENEIQKLPDWEQDEVRNGIKILERWGDMLSLPDKRELGEYDMMSDFASDFPDRHISDGLCIAVDGPGAFRRFKNVLRRFNIEEDWYAYKEEAMLAFARRWCDENSIPYDLEGAE